MADIRINALATTAASTASDDFVAVDGSANGTRKLNAYSPTFGGNLTVSGSANLTSSSLNSFIYDGAGWVWTSTGTGAGTVKGGIYAAGGLLHLTANSSLATNRFSLNSSGDATLAGNLTVSGTGTSSFASGSKLGVGTTSPGVTFVAVGAPATLNYTIGSTSLADIRSTSAAATNGGPSLTFSGYYQTSLNTSTYGAIKGVLEGAGDGNSAAGSLTFLTANAGGVLSEWARLSYTGNLLIGTTTDGGQKLQVNGTALLGTDNASLGAYFDYNGGISGNATLWLKQTTKSSSTYTLTGGGTYTALNAPSGGSIYLRINNSDALTLDSSLNATFAGRVTSNGTGFGVGADSTANTPFYALSSVNGTFGMLVKNTNAGSGAFAGVFIEADSGQASVRQHSTLHSVWPGKTLISAPSGGTGLVLLTNGAGDAIDFWTNATQALSIDASQNIVPGTAALATTATNGFIYLQTCAGAPTGVPTTYTGRVASIYDTTNNKLYVYNGGWKSVTLA